jgi:hypothetical protein
LPAFPLDTGHDLRDKIDWEGGIIGALEWGLDPEDICRASDFVAQGIVEP